MIRLFDIFNHKTRFRAQRVTQWGNLGTVHLFPKVQKKYSGNVFSSSSIFWSKNVRKALQCHWASCWPSNIDHLQVCQDLKICNPIMEQKALLRKTCTHMIFDHPFCCKMKKIEGVLFEDIQKFRKTIEKWKFWTVSVPKWKVCPLRIHSVFWRKKLATLRETKKT